MAVTEFKYLVIELQLKEFIRPTYGTKLMAHFFGTEISTVQLMK